MYLLFFKRPLDIILSLLGLIIISPLLLVITFLSYFVFNSSPFYLQDRPGKNGKIFRLIKYKTMNDNCDLTGTLLPDNQRITAFGRFMRNYSLDEYPQLLNVLKGDMSLIGPRPLLVKYLPLYNKYQSRRHEVRPGMTGWAAVNGRNALSWDEKFELDVWYVDNISFFLDVKILVLTFQKMLKREGINLVHNHINTPFNSKQDKI